MHRQPGEMLMAITALLLVVVPFLFYWHHIDEDALNQGLSPGVTVPPREHMEMSGEIFGPHHTGGSQGVLLALTVVEAKVSIMYWYMVHVFPSAPQQRITQLKISVVPTLRSPALGQL